MSDNPLSAWWANALNSLQQQFVPQQANPLASLIMSNPVGTSVIAPQLTNATPIDTRTMAQRRLADAAPMATTMVLGMAGEAPRAAKLQGSMPSEPGYVYHATNAERLQNIANSGKLNTHKPGDFTDQDVWPDGSTQKRNYFTPSAQNTWQFAPEEGMPVLLRMNQQSHPIQSERGTGDLYSTKPVAAKHLEYHAEDGSWQPVSGLKSDK